ncbi:MAG: serine/threonine protein kinase [Firmicutes bacterium]|nr:serine/threonine protein kinase [Bacillota bacterium]
MLQKNEIINQRYKVESVIGEGGMSTVYAVYDTTLDKRWAMKETLDIFPDKDKKDIIDQFHREAKMLAGLSHPNLPKVIDFFSENQRHYLVEELIEGQPSSDLLEKSQAFDEFRVLSWALQICDLLDFLHNNNIIYRDLKPGNIMVDKNDKIFLVDFGIARFFQGGKSKDTVIIGTPGFASPEHYGRGETDRKSDIFSLGATLHYMVTGKDPADKPFHFDIPFSINPQVSIQTGAIIMKCVEMDPSRRYQTAAEVKEAISSMAIPALKKGTRMLQPAATANANGVEYYHNSSDLLGMTTQFLSYLSIFPLSMGVSGVAAFFLSLFNPILGLGGGIISFPLLCMEFWKRLDKVYGEQDIVIETGRNGVSYKSRKIHVNSNWLEIQRIVVIKNPNAIFGKKIKEVQVSTRAGEFVFDQGFNDFNRLIDMLVTNSGLAMAIDSTDKTVYSK